MVWSPLEVLLILLVWFPVVLPIVLLPYLLTIFSINCLAGGTYAVTQKATEPGAWGWFALLSTVFTVVFVGGVILLLSVVR